MGLYTWLFGGAPEPSHISSDAFKDAIPNLGQREAEHIWRNHGAFRAHMVHHSDELKQAVKDHYQNTHKITLSDAELSHLAGGGEINLDKARYKASAKNFWKIDQSHFGGAVSSGVSAAHIEPEHLHDWLEKRSHVERVNIVHDALSKTGSKDFSASTLNGKAFESMEELSRRNAYSERIAGGASGRGASAGAKEADEFLHPKVKAPRAPRTGPGIGTQVWETAAKPGKWMQGKLASGAKWGLIGGGIAVGASYLMRSKKPAAVSPADEAEQDLRGQPSGPTMDSQVMSAESAMPQPIGMGPKGPIYGEHTARVNGMGDDGRAVPPNMTAAPFEDAQKAAQKYTNKDTGGQPSLAV